jgi:hypothetical protein
VIRLFVGHDPREAVAFNVFAHSVITRASEPVAIVPLALNMLQGVYKEEHTDGSNAFIYSRFLVPYLCGFEGWAIFADGDMLCQDDIAMLWEQRDESRAVQVAMHSYKTAETTKYLGSKNEDYPRKNWSSVILWNCGHPENKILTPEFVAGQTGAFLHRFSWLDDLEIGHLNLLWNWLAIEYPYLKACKPCIVHYTLGTPCFDGYHDRDYAKEWYAELENMLTIPDAQGIEWLRRGINCAEQAPDGSA